MNNFNSITERKSKTNNISVPIIAIMFTLICLMMASASSAATLYMGADESYTNLQDAMAAMSAGDTLIIRDGTYTGTQNVLDHSHYPPEGTAGNYTTIKAENSGEVIFDGENARRMFDLYGSPADYFSYMRFEGIGFCNSSSDLVRIVYSDHIKMIKCYAYDAVGTGQDGDGFTAAHSSYILFEDCYSYGAARKHFYIANSAEKIVVRRCVVRHDRHYDYSDQEAFMVYDASQVELQNCISVDGDQGAFYTGGGGLEAKSFTTRDTGTGVDEVYIRGCMSIGNDDMIGVFGSNPCGVDYIDFVHWDSNYGIRVRAAGSTFEHCTIGNVSGTGTYSVLAYLEAGDPITNSLLYEGENGIRNATGNDYNALYNISTEYIGASPGANSLCNAQDSAIDPIDGAPGNRTSALKYLLRVEDGSDLDGRASDGGDVGATILKRIGEAGTLWGEAGYNTTTDESLWPYPNEVMIREKMRAYAYSDVNGAITGIRGFCADGQTLTKYIWEYLGNPIPDEIISGITLQSPVNLMVIE